MWSGEEFYLVRDDVRRVRGGRGKGDAGWEMGESEVRKLGADVGMGGGGRGSGERPRGRGRQVRGYGRRV